MATPDRGAGPHEPGARSFIVEGVVTTIPFLSRVIRHPAFVSGDVDTKFLERTPELFEKPE